MTVATTISTIDLTVGQLAAGIASGAVSPITAVHEALARIDARDGDLKAWAYVDRAGATALAAELAEEAKAGRLRGPLHGVPVGIKDVLHVADMPTLANSRTTDPAQRYPDSTVAAGLRAAGAIILGKCATVEFAGAGDPPPTRNPWNLDHTPGGSSSGSGAAVGARMVPAAIGTQTGGSNLRPAAYCGIAGFKPSYGGLSRDGVHPLAWTLDHPGIIARAAADLGLIYRAIAARPPAPQRPRPDWRIGVVRQFFLERSEPAMVTAVEAAAAKLEAAGATVREVPLPAIFDAHRAVHRILLSSESSAFHAARASVVPGKAAPKTLATIAAFSLVPAVYYIHAQRVRRLIRDALVGLFDDVDLLIMPTAPGPAPAGIASTGDSSMLSPWSQVGFPAATVPCGVANGLPLGLQIVGPPGHDGRVLAAAEHAESLLGLLALPA